ncbi:conserved phage C-terminal domain-containing protein [Lactobacillus crispatus]|uniref:conserved phage C-terminal domain-containing protein n=1 Tax=Lactobacillus crispatus TaxID=47770 RepID=UPI001472EF8F|nr:conserved phage C-terminal domain-containing protein [Lactobacillus crispatus]MBE5057525.1 conserved phage C-terminal domain-containing protein [Lactobacillus crispatus]NME25376.1 hypothetical protein [Lactobacillus crispatus]
MKNPNLKIPLVLINNGLPILVILVYSELNGLYSKNNQCYITDKELSRRLNRSISSIQRAMHELRNYDLIQTKQKPNYKGRFITVTPVDMNKFLLIPVKVIRNKDLSLGALLVYGSLYSRHHKQIKINADKHKEDAPLIISVTKSELANELNKSVRAVQYQLRELENKHYIQIDCFTGINLEIILVPIKNLVDNSQKDGRPKNDPSKKCVPTLAKNAHRGKQKMRTHPSKKRATNKYLIDNINKDDYSSSFNKDHPQAIDPFNPFEVSEPLKEPVYYDSIPNENDMPPQTNKDETTKDIAELNTLDIQNATQHKTSPITGKSGSESGNKYIDRSTKPTRKKYHAYNGFNLDYQVDQLRKMLNSKTGKHYPITNQRPLIEQRLKDGFTLYDFERAIDYLVQQKQSISVKELVINISNYLNKINSN